MAPIKNLGVANVTELPLNVVSPVLKIFRLPPLPLIKLLVSPKKKSGDFNVISLPLMVAFCVRISMLVPSNLKNSLEPSPTYILGVPLLYSNWIP